MSHIFLSLFNFIDRIDTWIRDENGEPSVESSVYQDRLSRGWYWGTEWFKETLLQLREAGVVPNRTYRSGPMLKDHAENQAMLIMQAGMKHFGLSEEALVTPLRGDITQAAIAARIFRETTVSQQWIAEQLGMKSAPNVSQQNRRFRKFGNKLPKNIKKWQKIKIF
ncbi:MAG: hypothetical protein P1V20_31130 [Verrucomicrobiales bacterium]|nr:hypothetical protein [Verrucomicrobiales bacterium]